MYKEYEKKDRIRDWKRKAERYIDIEKRKRYISV